MVGVLTIDSPKSDSECWKHIDWKKAEAIVNRLQIRIVKAIKAGNKNKVRSLQRLLARSFAAKLKAVKRVISNRGRNTARVDGVKWNTPAKRWREKLTLTLTIRIGRVISRVDLGKRKESST